MRAPFFVVPASADATTTKNFPGKCKKQTPAPHVNRFETPHREAWAVSAVRILSVWHEETSARSIYHCENKDRSTSISASRQDRIEP